MYIYIYIYIVLPVLSIPSPSSLSVRSIVVVRPLPVRPVVAAIVLCPSVPPSSVLFPSVPSSSTSVICPSVPSSVRRRLSRQRRVAYVGWGPPTLVTEKCPPGLHDITIPVQRTTTHMDHHHPEKKRHCGL